jgi:putative ABC transport system substrate-binding protein
VWPLAARAQQAPRLPTIGFLGSGTPATLGSRVAAFVQRLRELGWIESRTVAIEYRWAESRSERATEIAGEFARLKVDVIVTSSKAKQETAVIPIVFANASDPVGSGLVGSLAQPGGNVTGLSNQQPDIATKRLALLREAVPDLRRVTVMGNTDNPPVRLEMQEVQAAAGTLGLECATLEIRRTRDIAPASTPSVSARKHSTSRAISSRTPIGFASASWRWARDCRRFGLHRRMSTQG